MNQPATPHCRQCGNPLNPTDKACGWCGTVPAWVQAPKARGLERLTNRQIWLITLAVVIGLIVCLFLVCIVLAYTSRIELKPSSR